MFTIGRIVTRKKYLEQRKKEANEHKLSKAQRILGVQFEDLEKHEQDKLNRKKKSFKPPPRSSSFPATLRYDPFVSQINDSNQIQIRVRFNLTDNQRQTIGLIWDKISKVSPNSGRGRVTIMEDVFEKLQKNKDLFLKKPMLMYTKRDHANLLAAWIDSIITKLKHQNTIQIPLPGAAKHANLKSVGMKSKHWEIFGECLCDTLYMQPCIGSFPGGPKSWCIFIATLTDVLRADFDKFRPTTKTNVSASVSVPVGVGRF